MSNPVIPNFDHIQFDPAAHRYTANGAELTGVTRYLQQFQKPFDKENIAARIAERENRPVAEILKEWEAKGKSGMALGSRVHEHIEAKLRGKAIEDDPFLAQNGKSDVPEIEAFNTYWNRVQATMIPEKIEFVIGSAALGLAGTVDCLVSSPKTKQFHLVDWKTGKFDTYNKFEYLLPPFDDQTASKLNIYSLQLSLYRLILEQAGLTLGDSYIVHLSREGAQTYKAVDYRPEFERLLAATEEVPF